MLASNPTVYEDEWSSEEKSCTRVRFRGPLEDRQWPEALQARVVTPGEQPRIHGYDAEGDLARYYGWPELILLALTSELPSASAAAALNVTAVFLSPVSTAHASTHAAVLSQLGGAATSATLGVTAIGLSERSRCLVDDHVLLLEWCVNREPGFPEQFRSANESDRSSVERLTRALEPTGLVVPGLDASPTRSAALLLVLFACGLRCRHQLEVAITLFGLPCAIAEAFEQKATEFSEYPINLPRFVIKD